MKVIIVLVVLSLAAQPVRSEVASRQAEPIGQPRSETAAALMDAKELAECESRWDAATHMTKKQWSQTCHRVRERLRLLDLRDSNK